MSWKRLEGRVCVPPAEFRYLDFGILTVSFVLSIALCTAPARELRLSPKSLHETAVADKETGKVLFPRLVACN